MKKVTFLYLYLLLLTAGSAWALSSVGADFSGGQGTSGEDAFGSLDFHVADLQKPFTTSLNFAHQHSTVGTESNTNQAMLDLSHALDSHWDGRAAITLWKDTVSEVHYAGPSAGFTYTWTEGETPPSPRRAPRRAKEGSGYELIQKEELEPTADRLSGQDSAEDSAPPPEEIAALSLNLDAFFYATSVDLKSAQRKVYDKKLKRYVLVTIPAQTDALHDTQTHPSLTFETPFWSDRLTPYLTAGHYFYSSDPAKIEALTGRPRLSGSVTQLNGLVGGFLKNNGEVGLHTELPVDITGTLRLGADQSATDNTWSMIQGVTLSRYFGDHVKLKADWSRSIQTGLVSDVFTGGAAYVF